MLVACATQGIGQQQQLRAPKLQAGVTSAAAPSATAQQRKMRNAHGLPTLPDLPSIEPGQQSMKTYGTRKKPDHGATAVGGWCMGCR